MRHRKYRLRPPTSSNYTAGEVLTFAAAEGAPQPTELVELTPADPPPLVLEFKPEDDKANGKKKRGKKKPRKPKKPPTGEGS